jgi:hypothetical protein
MTDLATLRFEREVCTRCGGCGRFSYNQIDGDRCYGCDGTGQKLTKRARIAADRMKAQRIVAAGSIVVGQRIRALGWTFNVRSIEQDATSTSKSLRDGVWIDNPPYISMTGEKASIRLFADTEVELIPSKAEQIEQLRAAIEYQNSLTKAGTPRARQREAA